MIGGNAENAAFLRSVEEAVEEPFCFAVAVEYGGKSGSAA
jgi:hypothetical protein